MGRDPVVTGLVTGETLVSWIDEKGNVKAQLFSPMVFGFRPIWR
jgi:hypothetical protein